jgi:hypothetical protein
MSCPCCEEAETAGYGLSTDKRLTTGPPAHPADAADPGPNATKTTTITSPGTGSEPTSNRAGSDNGIGDFT